MKGRGRPKKCAKKLNFNKPTDNSNINDIPLDSSICNKQDTLSSLCENEAIKSDIFDKIFLSSKYILKNTFH